MFGERDPLGYVDSGDLYQVFGYGPINTIDPFGNRLRRLGDDSDRGAGVPSRGEGVDVAEMTKGLLSAIELSVGVNYSDEFIVDFILDQAEQNNGSSGLSLEGMGVHWFVGAHLGLNLQVFYNEGSYSAGLYFFESLSTPLLNIFEGGPDYKHEYQKMAGPFGTLGESIGGDVAVNVARAKSRSKNKPENWQRFFETVSASVTLVVDGIPIPIGGSVFWSDDFFGVEIGFAPSPAPLGAAYTRPFFHLLYRHRVDRETLASLYRIILREVR